MAALRSWITAAKIATGPILRPIAKGERIQDGRLTDRSVAKGAKAHAARVRLDPVNFSGHSLRSGFFTSAAARGASIFKMADQSRHESLDTLRGYVRDAEFSRITQGRDSCRLVRSSAADASSPLCKEERAHYLAQFDDLVE